MMTILNQTEILECSYPAIIAGLIIAAILAIYAAGFVYVNNKSRVSLICCFLAVLLLLSAPILCSITSPTGRYRYEGLIDEDMSMAEIYDQYNIVEKRGDIWVLEDKEEQN